MKIHIYQIVAIRHVFGKADMTFKGEVPWLDIAKAANIGSFYETCQGCTIEFLDNHTNLALHGRHRIGLNQRALRAFGHHAEGIDDRRGEHPELYEESEEDGKIAISDRKSVV